MNKTALMLRTIAAAMPAALLPAVVVGQDMLPFYEHFEPIGGTPADCQSSDRGHWPFQTAWAACDTPGKSCPDDPVLPACTNPNLHSRCFGPLKFESWPDFCAGGHVYRGYRAGRQPVADPYWYSIYHRFAPAPADRVLRAGVWFYDSTDVMCACECNCDPYGPPGRPNYQVQGWLCLQKEDRSEGFALGINSYSGWLEYSWYTASNGWQRTGVTRTRGWHYLQIEVRPYSGGQDVRFTIDGVEVAGGVRMPGAGSGIDVNQVRLGGDPAMISQNHLSNTFQEIWYDDVAVTACGSIRPDTDEDGDVDQDDFAGFQRCLTGPATNGGAAEGFDAGGCGCLDFDGDADVDQDDFERFDACTSGAGVPVDPACDGF